MENNLKEIKLSPEQELAFNKYKLGENIFITGPGGSGKSELIKKIYDDAQYRGKNIQVTALTGCAAVLLKCKAKTIHSWSGIGIANQEPEFIIKKVIENKYRCKPWRETDILIIDEVSMMSLKIFNILDQIGRKARRPYFKPFGGIQLIFSGDFYQLPPIGEKTTSSGQFCFESEEWNNTFPFPQNQIQLVKIFRQKDDTYANVLNQIREGKLKKSSNELLINHMNKSKDITTNTHIKPTKIFPLKSKVDQINQYEMSNLETPELIYKIKPVYDLPMTKEEKEKINLNYTKKDIEAEIEYLKSSSLCEKEVKLKIGAQVMCIVNIEIEDELMICNGSQGIITGITNNSYHEPLPIVKFTINNKQIEMTMGYHIWPSENIPGIGISQIPLILAWAITIHKSQGATLEYAEIDVGSNIFESGQTYVALSRVKSLEGLMLKYFDASKIKINKKVKEYYEKLTESQLQKKESETQTNTKKESDNDNKNIFNDFICK
jgi:ATP-dependent DNA helicase PIF1